MAGATFWNDQERARDVVKQVKQLKGWIEGYDGLASRITGARELDELLAADHDDGMAAELDRDVVTIRTDLDAFELKSLMRGTDDFRDAQL